MLQVITTLLPIFGLILLGFVCRRTGRLGDGAASELNRVVVWLCLPALLFRTTATTAFAEIWQPDFVLVLGLTSLLVFAVTLAFQYRKGRPLTDASIDGLAAAYANTGYVGIPLCLFVLGDEGLAPALVATLLVVCVLFSVAITAIEISRQAGQGALQVARKVLLALLKNPLVLSPLLGALWNLGGLGLPAAPLALLKLLGDATTPCALVSLGAFLAQRQPAAAGGSLGLVGIKLVVHPLLTWLLAYHVFHLPPVWAQAAVLLSALPTGTGPYMLAELYGREAAVVSRTILLTTLGSVLTLSVCLRWLL